jgi:hypothetical protein
MSLNCGTALTGAKFTSQNAAIAQTAFAGGSVRYPNKFFLSGKDSSKFFEHLYFAKSCKNIVRVIARTLATGGRLYLSERLAGQAVVANADATIREAMARLRFEIAMIVLGECCSGLVLCHLSLAFRKVKISLQTSSYQQRALKNRAASTRAWHLHTLIMFVPLLTQLGARVVTAV